MTRQERAKMRVAGKDALKILPRLDRGSGTQAGRTQKQRETRIPPGLLIGLRRQLPGQRQPSLIIRDCLLRFRSVALLVGRLTLRLGPRRVFYRDALSGVRLLRRWPLRRPSGFLASPAFVSASRVSVSAIRVCCSAISSPFRARLL